MLIVKIHNDGTGDTETGNYNCEVLITETPTKLRTIAAGRVERFRRHNGWRALLQRVADMQATPEEQL